MALTTVLVQWCGQSLTRVGSRKSGKAENWIYELLKYYFLYTNSSIFAIYYIVYILIIV